MSSSNPVSQRAARLEASRIVAAMRQAIAGGEHWFPELLKAVRFWPLSEERVGDRDYRYLIAGEAFDWLLLAERLCEELADLIPEEAAEALIFHGQLPEDMEGEDLRPLLGAKYRPHLNFIYGVRVETAIQLAVQDEVHKERLAIRIWENGHVDDEVFTRIYGRTRQDLLQRFWLAQRRPASGDISLADLTEFTYWLFRYRVQNCEPALVASDTRKGLSFLQRQEARRPGGWMASGLR